LDALFERTRTLFAFAGGSTNGKVTSFTGSSRREAERRNLPAVTAQTFLGLCCVGRRQSAHTAAVRADMRYTPSLVSLSHESTSGIKKPPFARGLWRFNYSYSGALPLSK